MRCTSVVQNFLHMPGDSSRRLANSFATLPGLRADQVRLLLVARSIPLLQLMKYVVGLLTSEPLAVWKGFLKGGDLPVELSLYGS